MRKKSTIIQHFVNPSKMDRVIDNNPDIGIADREEIESAIKGSDAFLVDC